MSPHNLFFLFLTVVLLVFIPPTEGFNCRFSGSPVEDPSSFNVPSAAPTKQSHSSSSSMLSVGTFPSESRSRGFPSQSIESLCSPWPSSLLLFGSSFVLRHVTLRQKPSSSQYASPGSSSASAQPSGSGTVNSLSMTCTKVNFSKVAPCHWLQDLLVSVAFWGLYKLIDSPLFFLIFPCFSFMFSPSSPFLSFYSSDFPSVCSPRSFIPCCFLSILCLLILFPFTESSLAHGMIESSEEPPPKQIEQWFHRSLFAAGLPGQLFVSVENYILLHSLCVWLVSSLVPDARSPFCKRFEQDRTKQVSYNFFSLWPCRLLIHFSVSQALCILTSFDKFLMVL